MKEDTDFLMFRIILVGILVGGVVGFLIGESTNTKKWQKIVVEKNMAEWKVDSSGNTTFCWKTNSVEQK